MKTSLIENLRWYDILATPELKPEESKSIELGLRGGGRLGSFEIATFYNEYKHFINQAMAMPGGRMIFRSENIAKANIKGVELKGRLPLDEALDVPKVPT